MKLVGLISGGKDSLYNLLQCISAGHEIVAIANIQPETKEELDSYMYQSVGHEAVSLLARALGLPIFRHKTRGKAICTSKTYFGTTSDEVEDLYILLEKVKKSININGVSVGAIASDYQRTRVENVCARLGLKCFAYLWRRDQAELLQEMIDAGVDAIIIKVASIGLAPEIHLGMHIKDALPHLNELNKKFGVNVCGEGGEYETLTVDCPLFHRYIEITESENVILSNDAFAPVGALSVKKALLKEKQWKADNPVTSSYERLRYIQSHIRGPVDFVQDCLDEPTDKKSLRSKSIVRFSVDERRDSSSDPPRKLEDYKRAQSTTSLSYSSIKAASSGSLVLRDSSTNSLSYISGWCCIGNIIGTTMQDALNCLQRNLEKTTYGRSDIVIVNVFLKNMSNFSSINKIYSQFMPEILPPARVCVGTPLLAPDASVMLQVVAHKTISKSQKTLNAMSIQERDTLHVQSISHWAPANIGPYSQCIKIGGIYYLSGQIPLVPGTMEILNKPILNQCRLTLRHVQRVLQAMDEELDYFNVFHAICYVTSQESASAVGGLWALLTSANHTTVAVIVVTALPKQAPLEWEVIACSNRNPLVAEKDAVVEDFGILMRRCSYEDPFVASVTCEIRYQGLESAEKDLKTITPKQMQNIMEICVEFLRAEIKTLATPLCMLKIFYKPTESSLVFSIKKVVKKSFDSKVVATAIPVVACENDDVILTITGVCH